MELQDGKNTFESNQQNNNNGTNEIIEIQSQSETPKILIDKNISKIDNNNLKEKNENNNIIGDNLIEKEESEVNEKLSLINIDIEKEKNNEINKKEKEKEKNKNRIYIEKDEDTEDDEEEELEYMKEDNYLFKFNKEYTNNDNDLHSKRITVKDNNEVYLMTQDENNIDNNENEITMEYKNDQNEINDKEEEEEEEDEKDLFPFKIVGDGKKKGSIFGSYKNNYLEIDSVKGFFKRYASSKEYPKNPKEIIEIKNIKTIKKQKQVKEFSDLEITFVITSKKGKKSEKTENFRFRHSLCRNMFNDSLITLWKCYINDTTLPKISHNILSFVDDRLGIIQQIGRGNKKSKENKTTNKKKFKIDFNKFRILKLLGVGGFGTVYKVRHILTGKIYAMKVMNKNYIIKKKYLHYVVSEFQIMKTLNGFPFILDLHYCFQTANYLYLIIDYCPNGDFTELESMNNVKLFFAELLLAFEYIHNKGVIYRDLKPENILLDETGHIKLCDFNLAKSGMNKNKRANSFCGSPLYFSPEMVMEKGATYKTDIYSIGLLMYEMIVGHTAFIAGNIKELYEIIKRNQINFNDPKLNGDAKDLILRILVKNPEDRIDIEDIKKHKYFKDIDFNKVLNKEYGEIITIKKSKGNKKGNKKYLQGFDEKTKEDIEYKKFLEQQKILDDDKKLTVKDGKITLKEMKLDQMKPMKNKVREFYYVKKEDIGQTQEFQLEINGKVENLDDNIDISSLIIEKYDA